MLDLIGYRRTFYRLFIISIDILIAHFLLRFLGKQINDLNLSKKSVLKKDFFIVPVHLFNDFDRIHTLFIVLHTIFPLNLLANEMNCFQSNE